MQKKASVLHLTETGSGQEAPDRWRQALGLTGGLANDPQWTSSVSWCLCAHVSWRARLMGIIQSGTSYCAARGGTGQRAKSHMKDRGLQLVFQIFPVSLLDRHTHD